MKKLYIIAGAVSFLAIISIWYFIFFRSVTEKVHPKMGSVYESIYGLGTVTAENIYNAKAGVSLTLKKLFVKEGDAVKARDPLVAFDVTTLQAPFDGTVTSVSFKQGEIVPAQVPIVTVMNLEHLYLEVSLEQQSVLRIRRGQRAEISFESLRNEPVSGVVSSIFPRENQFIVRIELQKWPNGVLPGMTADTAIQVGKKENALLIPLNSIQAGLVTRIRNGKKEKIPVKLGVVDNASAEVVSGDLNVDDEILLRL